MRTIHVNVEDFVYDNLEDAAERNNRLVSDIVRACINLGLRSHDDAELVAAAPAVKTGRKRKYPRSEG